MEIILCLIFAVARISSAMPSVYPTGTTIYNQGKAYEGYTLIRNTLIDMSGNIVHEYQNSKYKTGYGKLLMNHNLLVFVSSGTPDESSGLIEIDWNGNIVWEYFDPYHSKLHHDFERLDNGNTLILCRRDILVPEISSKTIKDDYIIEVDRSGKIVWEWYTSEHFNEFGFSAEAGSLIAYAGNDWSHTNSIQSLPNNSLRDSRFKKGNILVSQRETNIIFTIDKATGQIVWKTGPDNNLTIGQHDAKMITGNLSGAGNILVFDNGGVYGYPAEDRLYSRVIEFNPVSYNIVSEYHAMKTGLPLHTFFSQVSGGAQKLPNGNLLIDEAVNGRFFEVDSSGEIVWEFINPDYRNSPVTGKDNSVYRIWRVGIDWLQ